MSTSSRELQVLLSILIGVGSAAFGAYTLWTGSYSASRHGSGLQIHGTPAVLFGAFWVVVGLLLVLAPFLESWWRSR